MEETTETDAVLGHYVYLYRDAQGAVCYVGYGADATRAASHQDGSHNAELERIIRDDNHSVEISGPFASPDGAIAVERGVLSALRANSNRNSGLERYQFRPLGVPPRYAVRFTQPRLNADEMRATPGALPAIFVYISPKAIPDGRSIYNNAAPPPDTAILERIDHKWHLCGYIPGWIAAPDLSPRTLVGVYGPPASRVIIGAVQIDPAGWATTEAFPGNRYRVPTMGPPNLDAHGWRGRRLGANLKFDHVPAGAYILTDSRGIAIGGSSKARNSSL